MCFQDAVYKHSDIECVVILLILFNDFTHIFVNDLILVFLDLYIYMIESNPDSDK